MKDWPKIELHHHLEGAAPSAFVRGLCAEKGMVLQNAFDEQGRYLFDDFAGFLRTYDAVAQVLQTPQDYARLTDVVLQRSADDGIIYLETFVSPDFCGGGDLVAWRDYLAAIDDAAAAMAPAIEARVVVTCIRHLGPDQARRIATCAAETAGGRVTGFGMAGDETVLHPRDFAWAFDCAREAGLRLTAHAGEFGASKTVADTLDALRPERIGHGIRAIDSPAVVERLVRDGITLELCPISNVRLRAARPMDHPVQQFRDAGVRVTISTDDPGLFGTSMTQEYEWMAERFSWDEADYGDVTRTALDAAFCDDATKARLRARVEAQWPST